MKRQSKLSEQVCKFVKQNMEEERLNYQLFAQTFSILRSQAFLRWREIKILTQIRSLWLSFLLVYADFLINLTSLLSDAFSVLFCFLVGVFHLFCFWRLFETKSSIIVNRAGTSFLFCQLFFTSRKIFIFSLYQAYHDLTYIVQSSQTAWSWGGFGGSSALSKTWAKYHRNPLRNQSTLYSNSRSTTRHSQNLLFL